LELALEDAIDLESATVGQAVMARVTRDVKDADSVVAPQGSLVKGHVVHLEKETSPFLMYEVGIAFDAIDNRGKDLPMTATMEEAGPAAGLIRQAKRFEPTFSRRHNARMDILVRKVQRGQGYLQWDGRRGGIPKGFKMKWKTVALE